MELHDFAVAQREDMHPGGLVRVAGRFVHAALEAVYGDGVALDRYLADFGLLILLIGGS